MSTSSKRDDATRLAMVLKMRPNILPAPPLAFARTRASAPNDDVNISH